MKMLTINIRFTEAQFLALRVFAAEENISMAEYVRRRVDPDAMLIKFAARGTHTAAALEAMEKKS